MTPMKQTFIIEDSMKYNQRFNGTIDFNVKPNVEDQNSYINIKKQ